MTAVLVGVRRQLAGGRLPWIATVSSCDVFGAESTSWERAGDGDSVAELQLPGAWYDAVARRWFAFGRGRHWCLSEPRRLTQ